MVRGEFVRETSRRFICRLTQNNNNNSNNNTDRSRLGSYRNPTESHDETDEEPTGAECCARISNIR